MINKMFLKISIVSMYILSSIGCGSEVNKLIESSDAVVQEHISIESRSCERITANLPERGRYDGISMRYLREIDRWELNFEHVPYINEVASPIGLLTLEEIAEISSLIIRRGECVNPPYATFTFRKNERFFINIDWWLVTDLYTAGLDATYLIAKNYSGEMTTKPMSYKEVTTTFNSKGFVDKFCSAFAQPDHSCVEVEYEKRKQSHSSRDFQPQWHALAQPFFSQDVNDLAMSEACNKFKNCGLEKESKLTMELVKLSPMIDIAD